MKQVNFTHPGGFPLEQETLERLQTAYRHELFEALKSHLSIDPAYDYIVSPPKNGKKGWAIIHPKNEQGVKTREGILYPIQPNAPTGFLKTTRTGTNLTYGTGVLQTAYFDYEAEYISPEDYANRPASPSITDALAIHYYDLKNPAFIVIKDIQAIEAIFDAIKTNIVKIENNIDTIDKEIKKYLPINGSKAMEGDLDLGAYRLSKLDIKATPTANVRVTDFRLGSNLGRALVNDSTKLTLNAGSDWQNTAIGGNVYLENVNTSDSTKSLLVIDNANLVTKNNTLIDSLINRITILEKQTTTAVPLGMIAIWSQPKPFPEGWEEYKPLSGRMPIGLDVNDSAFNQLDFFAGSKTKKLEISEIPSHSHSFESDNNILGDGLRFGANESYQTSAVKQNTQPTGGGESFSILNPYRVVYFIKYTGISSDTIKPTTPTGLQITNTSTTSVALSWNASTDNVGINTYLISVNDGIPFEVGNTLQYTVSGLSPSTYYNFYVIAKDAAGNVSAKSNTEGTTTTAIVIPNQPTLPTEIRARFTGVNRILIDWTAEPNNVGVIYQILEGDSYNGNFTPMDTTTDTQYIDTNVIKYNSYFYKLQIINANGHPLTDPSGVLHVKAVPDLEDE